MSNKTDKRYYPPRIEDVGLEKYLESLNINYKDFCTRVKNGESDATIARAVGKERRTIKRWREILDGSK